MSAPAERPVVWRPSALIFVAAGAMLLVVAIAVRNPVPLFAALPLLLAPAAAAWGAPVRLGPASVRWSDSGTGGEARIDGALQPPAGIRARDLCLSVTPPPPFEPVESPPPRLRESELGFSAVWRSRFPGFATVAPPWAAWRDPLGLVERSLTVEAPTLRLERFPSEVARIGRIRLRRTSAQPGENRARALGSSGEFFSIRESAPTDTPRQINWRATARYGRLLANEFQVERTGDVVILLDLRPTALGTIRDLELLSIARGAALGIASGFLTTKARVGLGLYDEFLTAIPLGSGRRQRYRILRALESAALGTIPGPGERLAVSLRRYFPTGVTTVLLSSLVDEEDSLALLRNIRRRGYPTVVLSPSPLPLMVPAEREPSPEEAIAYRLRRLLRRRQMGRTWSEAPVVDWEEYWSLAPFVRLMSAPRHAPQGAA